MKMEDTTHGVLEHWTPEDVAEAFARDEIVLIDVRTPQEFGVERIDGALLAPMQALMPEHLPEQSVKRIVLHCGSGARSRKVAERCLAAGAERMAHMEGGFESLKPEPLGKSRLGGRAAGPVSFDADQWRPARRR